MGRLCGLYLRSTGDGWVAVRAGAVGLDDLASKAAKANASPRASGWHRFLDALRDGLETTPRPR